MPRAIHICGDDSLTLAECSDCNEVKSRVARLEECCDTVKSTLTNHDTRITNNANNITKNANDITQLRNDLANYYTKSETYTRQEVLDLIGNIETVSIKAVDSLPDTGESNVIYLVPNGGKKPDVKDEYIWVNNEWEKIGNTKIDLSNYVTTDTFNNEINSLKDAISTLTDDFASYRQYVRNTYQPKLTAGDNITIDDANVISATCDCGGDTPCQCENQPPTITGLTELEVKAGEEFDPLEGVVATDCQGNTLSVTAGEPIPLELQVQFQYNWFPASTGGGNNVNFKVYDLNGDPLTGGSADFVVYRFNESTGADEGYSYTLTFDDDSSGEWRQATPDYDNPANLFVTINGNIYRTTSHFTVDPSQGVNPRQTLTLRLRG